MRAATPLLAHHQPSRNLAMRRRGHLLDAPSVHQLLPMSDGTPDLDALPAEGAGTPNDITPAA